MTKAELVAKLQAQGVSLDELKNKNVQALEAMLSASQETEETPEAEVAEETPEAEVAEGGHKIAKGKALITRAGMKSEGDTVTEDMVGESFAAFVKSGHIVEK